jgi:hypothetical protein
MERIRIALPIGPIRVGVSHSFTWGRKQIQFPKCCVLFSVFRIPGDGRSPKIQQFRVLYITDRTLYNLGEGIYVFEFKAGATWSFHVYTLLVHWRNNFTVAKLIRLQITNYFSLYFVKYWPKWKLENIWILKRIIFQVMYQAVFVRLAMFSFQKKFFRFHLHVKKGLY